MGSIPMGHPIAMRDPLEPSMEYPNELSMVEYPIKTAQDYPLEYPVDPSMEYPLGPIGQPGPDNMMGSRDRRSPRKPSMVENPMEPTTEYQQGQNQNPSVPVSQPSLPPANNGDYCAISRSHTMCRFSGLSSSCSRNLVSNFRGLSEAGKRIILDRHNKLRSRVAQGQEPNQPSASNMRKLVWNDELAVIAQRWADQCTFEHDPERSKLDRTSVGQNLAIFYNSRKFSWAEIESSYLAQSVQNWYDEVTKPGFSRWNIKPFQFSSGTGHYTQVVWAETREVGCGLVYYFDGSWYTTLVVCNYAVAGNMAGGEMYKEGRSCSSCPVSGSGCQDGLCLG